MHYHALPLPLSLWPRVDFGLNAICRLILFVLLSAPGASGGWAGIGVGNEKNEPQNEMVFSPGITIAPSHQNTKFDFF